MSTITKLSRTWLVTNAIVGKCIECKSAKRAKELAAEFDAMVNDDTFFAYAELAIRKAAVFN
jgi:hypothetical protein